ncbi:hypothetical protein ABZ926_13925 [Streptomyces litmocidini]|uniref:hypothetical protein n=1 Tax=Streptomyces litmocidini TaxID=67318 RepID=UPI0033F34DD2
MRPLATRRLTALAISAALTLGAAGTAFADEHPPSSPADRAVHAPLPDTPALDLPAAPTDVVSDALTSVQKAIAGLLATVTSGAGGLVPQVTSTLTSLVDLALGTVLGALPKLPALPGIAPEAPAAAPEVPATAPQLPVTAPELPVEPPVESPAAAPELSAVPELPVELPLPAG